MPKSLLIVGFSPIQGFIVEARRVADLSAGSQILSRLAQAVRKALAKGGEVIYPQTDDNHDAPNVLVAIVPAERVKEIAASAEDALKREWKHIAQAARQQREGLLRPDKVWNAIWERQINHQWEFYWGAANLVNDDQYKDAYDKARKALDAAKRARFFEGAGEESGLKDSLSGARSALRTDKLDAKEYWAQIFKGFEKADDVRLRENERLDAIGFVKRFYDWGEKKTFESTSDVAASAYIRHADKKLLSEHARIVCALLEKTPKRDNDDWPKGLDADLLYEETLTPQRLKSDYRIEEIADPQKLEDAQRTLKKLYGKSGRPPTYYAIVVMDGDNMGKAVDACRTKDVHKKFSGDLSEFASAVHSGMEGKPGQVIYAGRDAPPAQDCFARMEGKPGQVIYAGGDDVLALLPLDEMLTYTAKWADEFSKVKDPEGKDCSASAGIAIVHHRSPLSAALHAARQAEKDAKAVNRNAPKPGTVCIRWLKRSGEELRVHSSWGGMAERVKQMREDFKRGLSTRFPYELSREADLVAMLEENARLALLKRLLYRHTEKDKNFDVDGRAKEWMEWSNTLDQLSPKLLPKEKEYGETENTRIVGFRELAYWLILARFLNQQIEKGGEQ